MDKVRVHRERHIYTYTQKEKERERDIYTDRDIYIYIYIYTHICIHVFVTCFCNSLETAVFVHVPPIGHRMKFGRQGCPPSPTKRNYVKYIAKIARIESMTRSNANQCLYIYIYDACHLLLTPDVITIIGPSGNSSGNLTDHSGLRLFDYLVVVPGCRETLGDNRPGVIALVVGENVPGCRGCR